MATWQYDRRVPAPMQVQGLIDVMAGYRTGMALTASGHLWAGGFNDWGQAGDGSSNPASSPVQVVGIDSGVTSLAIGGEHTVAVLPDGTVWSWGNNSDGRLGRGQPLDVLVPTASLLD
jgi:alpha-tubulin suppressor-like RCC1 family protein